MRFDEFFQASDLLAPDLVRGDGSDLALRNLDGEVERASIADTHNDRITAAI
jgi:hypothetical protein